MAKRSFGSGFGKGRRNLAVERLEGRSLLAGNVNVFVSGGNLIITGDNKDNNVFVTQVDDQYQVVGFSFGESGPTGINGDTEEATFITKPGEITGSIIVDMKKGNDIVAIGNSVEDLDALAEDCFGVGLGLGSGSGGGSGGASGSFSQTALLAPPVDDGVHFYVPGSLVVNTGDGNDHVVVDADVKYSAVINTGNGNDGVAFGEPNSFDLPRLSEGSEGEVTAQQIDEADGVEVGGDLIILTGKGSDNVCVDAVVIHNYLNVQTGDGVDTVGIEAVAAGHMGLFTGAAIDNVNINLLVTEREVLIDTGAGNDNLRMNGFGAGLDFEAALHEEEVRTYAGYVTVLTGAGNDQAEFFNFNVDGLYVDTGAGNDGLPTDSSPITIEGGTAQNSITLLTGSGNDLVVVEDVTARNLIVNTGAGNDGTLDFPVEIYNVNIDGSLVVSTGLGNDVMYLHSGDGESSTVSQNVVVDMSSGNDIAEIIDMVIGNDLTVLLGAGNDNASIGVEGDSEAGAVEATLSVGNNAFIDASAGRDGLQVGNLTVDNNLTILLGAGDDTLLLTAKVGGNATIDAGAGKDNVSIGGSTVSKTTVITMGTGNDTLNIFNSQGESEDARLYVFGGPGKDTFNNDLGLDENGNFDDNHIIVAQFEIFAATQNT